MSSAATTSVLLSTGSTASTTNVSFHSCTSTSHTYQLLLKKNSYTSTVTCNSHILSILLSAYSKGQERRTRRAPSHFFSLLVCHACHSCHAPSVIVPSKRVCLFCCCGRHVAVPRYTIPRRTRSSRLRQNLFIRAVNPSDSKPAGW